jgi:hypothetical protein
MDTDEKIVQVSGFSVDPARFDNQVDYMVVGVTNTGRVVITTGDGQWGDISPKKPPERE